MHDLSFTDLLLLTRMAALGSLSHVAKEHGVATTTVQRALDRMERLCQQRLFIRSRQGLRPTAEGAVLLEACIPMLKALGDVQHLWQNQHLRVKGTVRVQASALVVEHGLIPSLPGLQSTFPELNLELCVDDRAVDLDQTRTDIAIRAGQLRRTDWVARKLGEVATGLYISTSHPAHERIKQATDLDAVPLLGHCGDSSLNVWRFVQGGHRPVQPHFSASTTASVAAMVKAGLGVGCLPAWVVQTEVQSGSLTPLLTADFISHQVPLHALYPPAHRSNPCIQACLQHWVTWFKDLDLSTAA